MRNRSLICLAILGTVLGSNAVEADEVFAGTGSSPQAVEGLLTYPRMLGANLVYVRGQAQGFEIAYGEAVDTASFRAQLNGQDVTGRFTPRAGLAETVRLPLRPGANHLKIELAMNRQGGYPGAVDEDLFDIELRAAAAHLEFSREPPAGIVLVSPQDLEHGGGGSPGFVTITRP